MVEALERDSVLLTSLVANERGHRCQGFQVHGLGLEVS